MVNYSHLEEKEEEEDSSSYFSSYSSLNFGIYVFRIPSFSPIFFRFISSTRRFFFSTRSLSTSYFESLSRSKCVPLIIFGFKYQLGHAEFFSEAVYRTASWRKIDGTVNDIGPLCSNKSEEREGKGERERESRWKIALDREFENRVPSKATLIRLGARSVPIGPP